MGSSNPTQIQQLLTPLRELITDKPPYVNGTLQLPASCFSLFYRTTEDGPDARRIDLANATFDELEQLAQACEPTSFDVKKKAATKKAKMDGPGKMNPGSFAPLLAPVQTNLTKVIRDYHFEGDKSSQKLKIELRELNVYSKGSFSKSRVEAAPDKNMFGSLVIIFPTPHEGGVLSLRSRASHEWSFDPSPETSDITHIPYIGYVVLFNDVEHEVAPVTSGHRVTLTYDLYADDHDGVISMKDQHSESIPPLANEQAFHDVFQTLLENREFLADGGTLAFGLMHAYTIENTFEHVYGALKGSDAVVYRTLRALGFDPVLRMYYHEWEPDSLSKTLYGHAAVFDKVVDFSNWRWLDQPEDIDMAEFVTWTHGRFVRRDDLQEDEDFDPFEGDEEVVWVTPVTTFNRKESVFSSPNERFTVENVAYGDLCLFVGIGKAGERLSYPKVAQHASEDDEDEDDEE